MPEIWLLVMMMSGDFTTHSSLFSLVFMYFNYNMRAFMVCIVRFSGKWCHEESCIQFKWNWSKRVETTRNSSVIPHLRKTGRRSYLASAEDWSQKLPRICEEMVRICGFELPCLGSHLRHKNRFCGYASALESQHLWSQSFPSIFTSAIGDPLLQRRTYENSSASAVNGLQTGQEWHFIFSQLQTLKYMT